MDAPITAPPVRTRKSGFIGFGERAHQISIMHQKAD
jgi:hypothetical protein